MRRVIAVSVCVAVQLAMVTAPLVHAHPDDHATDHHAAHAIHAHLAGHTHTAIEADAAAIGDEDHDRAVFLDTFVGVAAGPLLIPGLAPSTYTLPFTPETTAHRSVDIAPGHDPPCVSNRSPRAPPAFLS